MIVIIYNNDINNDDNTRYSSSSPLAASRYLISTIFHRAKKREKNLEKEKRKHAFGVH